MYEIVGLPDGAVSAQGASVRHDAGAVLVVARALARDDAAARLHVDVHVGGAVAAGHERVGVVGCPAAARQQLEVLARPDRTRVVRPALAAAALEPHRLCNRHACLLHASFLRAGGVNSPLLSHQKTYNSPPQTAAKLCALNLLSTGTMNYKYITETFF